MHFRNFGSFFYPLCVCAMRNGHLKTPDNTLYRPLPMVDTNTTGTISLSLGGLHTPPNKVRAGLSLLRPIIEVLHNEIISQDQFQV